MQYLNKCIVLDLHVIIYLRLHDYLGWFLSIWIRGDWSTANCAMVYFYSLPDHCWLKNTELCPRGVLLFQSIFSFQEKAFGPFGTYGSCICWCHVTSEVMSSFIPSCCKCSLRWPHLVIASLSEMPFNDIYEGKCHMPSTLGMLHPQMETHS